MKRFYSRMAVLGIVFVVLNCATSSGIKFTAGTYEGTAPGFNGDVTMEVTVDAGRILSIRTISHNDTPDVSGLAYERIPQAIIDGQTLAVDGVSGATFSSKGIIATVTAALEKSGADIKALQTKKAKAAAGAVKRGLVTESADVVVIGAGGAGLAVGISASQNGAKVIILEKMPRAGGNTIISGAAYNAVDPERQNLRGLRIP